MFELKDKRFYGNYRAKVLDNNDPLKLGRVKCEIYPMLTDILATQLPWTKPAMPLSMGAGAGYGSFTVPKIGSFIYVFFEAGDIYQGVYFAEAQTAVAGLPADRTTNYPNRHIQKTASGIEIYTDDTLDEVGIVHPTGTVIKIDTNGQVIINSVTNVLINSL